MIERFNFYDVYGYLLPGVALLALGWFPFWFVAGKDVPSAWASAIVALLAGYAVGHVLSRMAQLALPSGRRAPAGTIRQPSDYLVDSNSSTLSSSLRERLIDRIEGRFGLTVTAQGVPDVAVRQRRQDAFLLCRRALIQSKVGSYAEQFEGLYATMRGWSAVAILSCAYYLGWAGGFLAGPYLSVLGYALFVPLLIMILAFEWRYLLWFISAALVPFGAVCAASWAPNQTALGMYALLAASLMSVFLARRFHHAYRHFAELFAATVYRDFYVLETSGKDAKFVD